MTDLPSTPRLALPLLAMAQAQKEVTHNEALALLDLLVQPAIEDGPQADPPVAPVAGQGWIVGAAATGAWADEDGAVALWTAGGWRFVTARPGMRVVRLSDGAWLRFDGADWVEPDAIASPAGGATVDSEARASIDALILALVGHGLLI
ncbi:MULTISPECIES: DUF2793 domain-containing protein [unclassified Sphingopyxis]|uniref:DUF2793 domain-containing protein n=1 Tax=unclassified Sphingopyxis TaxID=2614943 RepID=UPI0007365A37|nr:MULTISPECIES: DUF2793 domain-containing protein [unclassified Sphingopyxis]KTE28747.1 hypothetical protein ATE62_21355 [Sphingopyxis sp. HIX]KTE70140.1 hypothetical protein ATE72_22815 [Sphingopyxis sp. HXXIV]